MEIALEWDKIRQAYPTMSAGALILLGGGLGWGFAWLLLRQQITTYRTRLEHAQDVIVGNIPAATYKPINFRKGRSMAVGFAFLAIGIFSAVVGTIILFWNAASYPKTPTVHQQPSAAVPTASNPIQPSIPSTAPRKFTDKTARELLALYDGRTPFQADPLIAHYKGLWIRVSGNVLNVLPDGPDRSIVVLKDGDRIIECRVGPSDSDFVKKLNKGDSAKLIGKISDTQNGSQLYLFDCEIGRG